MEYTTPEVSEIIEALKMRTAGEKVMAVPCEVCSNHVFFGSTCYHPKNGYCALFRLQAAKDMVEFNMKGRICSEK